MISSIEDNRLSQAERNVATVAESYSGQLTIWQCYNTVIMNEQWKGFLCLKFTTGYFGLSSCQS